MAPDETRPPTPPQQKPNQMPREQRPDRNQQGGRRDGRPQGRPDAPRPRRSPEDRNVVFIGNKPPMNYVLAVVTQFNSGSDEVVIKARGKAISQAVDVAEIVRNKFFQKASVKNVGISTESVTGDDGRKRAVSSIEIRLHVVEGTSTPPAPKPAAEAPAASPPAPVKA